jgi:4-diphosphocytidyl-2-C-methyl-D-erythritol kinase
VIQFSPAKINLGLRLLRRRPDGYHEIETFFHTLAWGDRVQLEPGSGITLEVHRAPDAWPAALFEEVPSGPENLAWRAAEQLCRQADLPGVHIRLEKRIPPGSGLGGGSSNAAAVLRGLASLYDRQIPKARLQALALGLGADVPFLLDGGCALAEGIGERLMPVPGASGTPVVLVLFPFGVVTADAYRWAKFDLTRSEYYRILWSPAAASPRNKDVVWLCRDQALRNDLEEAVGRAHPEIPRLRRLLLDQGALYASMTGSGSAMYGICADPEQADAVARRVGRAGFHAILTQLA